VHMIEDMIAAYIPVKYDDDALRVLSGYDLNIAIEGDEDARYDLAQRLLYVVMQQIDWNKIVAKAQENLPDDDEETNPDDD
jgi:hypothetical protein